MKLRASFFSISVGIGILACTLAGHSIRLAADDSSQFHQYFPFIAGNYCSSFYDTFSDLASDWFTGTIGSLQAEIIDGEYQLNFTGGGSVWLMPGPMCARTSYRAAVDARWRGSAGNFIGLLFELDEEDNDGYLFAINTDDRVWFVFTIEGNNLETTIAPVGNVAILPGTAVNRLAVERTGNTIAFSINGTQVGELMDNSPGRPVVAGVAAASYTTQASASARFDNFIFEGSFD